MLDQGRLWGRVARAYKRLYKRNVTAFCELLIRKKNERSFTHGMAADRANRAQEFLNLNSDLIDQSVFELDWNATDNILNKIFVFF